MAIGKSSGGSKTKTQQVSVLQELQLLRDVYEGISTNTFAGIRAEPFPDGLNYFRFKLDLTGVGSIEVELSGKSKTIEARAASGFDPLVLTKGMPCVPTNAKAKQILQTCEDVYEAKKGDCNLFVKAASNPYFGDIFKGLDADGIIGKLADAASGWTSTKSIADCVSQAQLGNFVIAGMTSDELGDDHGHLAVVVACPPQLSGSTKVPIGYAGSIGSVSIKGERLSSTFKAQLVRDEKVAYFWKAPSAGLVPETDDSLFSEARVLALDVGDLDLSGAAKTGAESLKGQFGGVITFTSGRRSVDAQAGAMANNIVSTGDRQWITKTYAASAERTTLQDWVNKNPAATTSAQIKAGLAGIMSGWNDSQRSKITRHFAGLAFDLQPVRGKQEQEIVDAIKALPSYRKFLDGENGVDVWHVEFN